MLRRKKKKRIEKSQAILALWRGFSTDFTIALSTTIGDERDRLQLINSVYEKYDLPKLRKLNEAAPLAIDNITARTDKGKNGLGLVTVIVPAYNSASTISFALRGLCDQVYDDLEIIVVDDCSEDNTREVVRRWMEVDSRIRLIEQKVNQGAYNARNVGLRHSQGDYITTHDADDWSHPSKILLQLKSLQQNETCHSVATHWMRTRPDLQPTTNWRLTDRVLHWNQSSLLFKRAVYEKIGEWDPVRVGGDTEYIWRIIANHTNNAFSTILPNIPLAMALDEAESLTRTKSTHVKTMFFGLRQIYRSISLHWHAQPNHLSPVLRDIRLRSCPRELFEKKPAPYVADSIVLGDFRDPNVAEKLLELSKEYLVRDRSLAVFHVPSPDIYNLHLHSLYAEAASNINVMTVVDTSHVRTKNIIKLCKSSDFDMLDSRPTLEFL
jgi:glycosyltransferase involved in cell wall biosynthesis